jgi:hypothetical protein
MEVLHKYISPVRERALGHESLTSRASGSIFGDGLARISSGRIIWNLAYEQNPLN